MSRRTPSWSALSRWVEAMASWVAGRGCSDPARTRRARARAFMKRCGADQTGQSQTVPTALTQ